MEYYDFRCNPLAAWLTVNQTCNMRCEWCYLCSVNQSATKCMSLDLAKDLVDIAVDAGAVHFNIIGGEPTFWPDLFLLFDYIKFKNATIGLITNATRFSDDHFWEEYQKNPADRISISVKSVNCAEFENVTNSDQFDFTMKGIERAVNFHKTGITTVYNSLVGMAGLKQIAIECKKLGANSIIVNMCSPVIDENGQAQIGYSIKTEDLASDTVEMLDFLNLLYDDEVEIDVQMPLCLFPTDFVELNLSRKKIMTLCQIFSRTGLNFDVEGNITVCNELAIDVIAQKGLDFIDGKSLLAHLNSQKILDFYSQILRYPADCCTECRWRYDCRGGCLMNWLVLDPSICHAI